MSFDYNKIPFGEKGKYVNTVIEIPKGSILKIEWRKKLGYFEIDRVEPAIFAKPESYGFIPGTLDEDGDELDTLLITEEPVTTGLVAQARVIGIVNFEDDAEMDHKIILVPADDRNRGVVKSYKEFGKDWKEKIEHHFNHYKDLKKPGSTKVLGFGEAEEAWGVIQECIDRYSSARKNE